MSGGPSWSVLGPSWGLLGGLGRLLGRSWGLLGCLGGVFGRLGRLLGRLGGFLGCLGGHFGADLGSNLGVGLVKIVDFPMAFVKDVAIWNLPTCPQQALVT